MKKLYIFTNGYPYGNGEKTFIEPELEYLKNDFEVSIVSKINQNQKSEEKHFLQFDSKIKYYSIGISDHFFLKIKYILRALFDPKWYKEFGRIMKERRLIFVRLYYALTYYVEAKQCYYHIEKLFQENEIGDVIVYSFWNTTYALALCWYKEKYHKINLVTRIHGYDLYNERVMSGKRQPFKTYMDSVEDAVLFLSEAGYQYYLDHFVNDIHTSKYFICRLGVPKARRIPNTKHGDAFELVSCSNCIPLKRIELIIGALAEMPKEIKINWVHFGDGVVRDELEKIAQKCLENYTNISYCFKGYVESEGIKEFYESKYIDCFITTSSSEGVPMSIMEALSYGIPVVATNVGGVNEEIEDNGVLLPENPSIYEIRDAILKIFKSEKSEIKRMRNNSLEVWEKKYDQCVNAERLISILRQFE